MPDTSLGPAVVIEQLLRTNLDSLQLAKELLAAQEAVHARTVDARSAMDLAARSDADPEAIETAVRLVAEAEAASAFEADLSTAWSAHRVETYELVSSAAQFLASFAKENA